MPKQTCNAAGQKLLRAYEGLRLTAYRCPAGLWTIGYGHTVTTRPGMTITEAQAEQLLASDLHRYEEAVRSLIRVPLGDNQFSALVCFTFNVGISALGASALCRNLNRGWYDQVPAQLKRWNKGGGRILPGLVRRRTAEAALWLAPDQPSQFTFQPTQQTT